MARLGEFLAVRIGQLDDPYGGGARLYAPARVRACAARVSGPLAGSWNSSNYQARQLRSSVSNKP